MASSIGWLYYWISSVIFTAISAFLGTVRLRVRWLCATSAPALARLCLVLLLDRLCTVEYVGPDTTSLTSGKTYVCLVLPFHPFYVGCLAIRQNLAQVMCGLLSRCCQNIPFSYIPVQRSHSMCFLCTMAITVKCDNYQNASACLRGWMMKEGKGQWMIFSFHQCKWGQGTTLFLLEGIFLSLGDSPAWRWVLPQPLRCILTTLLSFAVSLQVFYTNPASTVNQVSWVSTSHPINPRISAAGLSGPNMDSW